MPEASSTQSGSEHLVWLTNRRVGVVYIEVVERPCPRCEAPAKKLCAGAIGGVVEETKKHPAFKWMYVCPERLEAPLSLL